MPIVSTYFDSELNEAIVEHFDSTTNNHSRRLLLTSRFPDLTGSYVIRFAGFFDSSFRSYDYAAGIYDGIFNLTRYLCHPRLIDKTRQDGCDDTESHKQAFVPVARTVFGLSEDSTVCELDSVLCQLLGAFYEQEFNDVHEWFPILEPGSIQYAVFNCR